MSDTFIDRAIIIEDQPNHKIKLIHKVHNNNDIVISTYKANPQFEEITITKEAVKSSKFESV